MHLHMHILRGLLEQQLPDLDAHLQKLGIGWDMFTTKFALTFGAAYFPMDELGPIYDVFFMDGWVGLYRLAIAFLESHQRIICGMDLVQLSDYLKTIRQTIAKQHGVRAILQRANEIRVRKDVVVKSLDTFFLKQAEKLLKRDANPTDWPRDYVPSLQPAKQEIDTLTQQHETDMLHFRAKLSAIDALLSKYCF